MHRIHRPSWLLLILLVLQLIWVQGLWAKETRYALVIGNSAYPSEPLSNPVNDATDIAAKLKKQGFSVTRLLDAGQREMEEAIYRFTVSLQGESHVGVFYFAGHGVESDGHNYLMPVDAKVRQEVDLKYEAVDAGRLLDGMRAAGNGVNLVVLDACRNNPYKRSFRSASRGLTRMSPASGSLVLYATEPGDVAADGNGRNGVFTQHLLAALDEQGIAVEEVFKRTAQNVRRATNGRQTPWMEGVILGQFYFIPAPAGAPGAKAIGPGGIPMQPNAAQSIELLYWQSIEAHPSAAGYEAYLQTFPNGGFTTLARARLADLISPWETQQSRQSFEPEMVDIPGGSFRMGCVSGKGCYAHESPVHQVRIKPFRIGKYEVTQAQWRAVMGENPSKFKGCDDCPVEKVSWDDIQGYLEKLNRKTGKHYRLPSEAEWEYAARAGTSGPYSFSGKISTAKANYNGDYTFDGSAKGKDRGKTLPVGSFPANPWGLHDVHGNVAEWVGDCWNDSYTGAPSDGSAWQSGDCSRRVTRGGGWYNTPRHLRSAYRYKFRRGNRLIYFALGFRLAQD